VDIGIVEIQGDLETALFQLRRQQGRTGATADVQQQLGSGYSG
jgi:hypothetical protein